jgi:hypothetical protein
MLSWAGFLSIKSADFRTKRASPCKKRSKTFENIRKYSKILEEKLTTDFTDFTDSFGHKKGTKNTRLRRGFGETSKEKLGVDYLY